MVEGRSLALLSLNLLGEMSRNETLGGNRTSNTRRRVLYSNSLVVMSALLSICTLTFHLRWTYRI